MWEARHDDGWCSITGGVTYRADVLRRLRGLHVFADYCKGELMALQRESGGGYRAFRINVAVERPTSFSLDANGELLVTSQGAGRVYRLVPR